MFKYTEKVGELLTSYEADTPQGIVDLVNIMNSNKKATIKTSNASDVVDDSVVVGP
ncbi:hypothetical protein [Clostridium estertheticum]|uniref:hypothetical protein n=1 Tax=Clostridium estertheticum TaxID=238834 RepID=UPI001C7D7F3C|nr:hypothetical protein [Clostridium estertheticum]MBX4266551.1 hypothetical protein [Clostridium estertheticum]WLC88109.1 hypothetical protein KTC95_19140 [Clostridium estertheticum]